MNESHINRINELLGESVIYESAKKKTKIKLSLDDGSKKEMDFDGSLNDAKKKYSGKKVKTIRKSKSGDIIGEAVIVSVEELNETKEIIPFGYFKITYSDGSSKKTEARAKTAEDFKKYLTQDGDTVTDEDDDGKETKKKIVKVEKLDEAEESDPVKKFPGQLKSILNTIKNSGSGKGPIEWAFPKVSYFHKGVIDAFVKYFQGKGYKVETGTSHPDRLYFNREIAQKLIKNEKLNESEETKESFKVNKELIVSESLPQYFETMLWSSTDMDSGEPLDKEYDVKDISKELKDSSKKDLLSFAEYCEKNCSKELEEYLEEEGYESFGHDFWLSRNGHGAGFFDRGNGYKALQKASKTLGSVDPMVNKGKIVV